MLPRPKRGNKVFPLGLLILIQHIGYIEEILIYRTSSGRDANTAIRIITPIIPAKITSTNPTIGIECHIGIECITSL
jgi:hypothetical protein